MQSATPAFKVAFAPGCANVACTSNSSFAAAAAAAAVADLTVVVLGIDQTIENEELDRVEITLPGQQVRRAERFRDAR
jgi:xylan 1,4-beta-xylosidase